MTTSEAVGMLRRRLGLTQDQFAKKLATTITTISRYERGRIGISEEMLVKLAEVAKEAGLADLQNFFQSQRNLAIVARVENLPSSGAQRRVSVSDLAMWRGMASKIAKNISEALEALRKTALTPEQAQKLDGAFRSLYATEANVAKELEKSIELYIDPQPKPERKTR